MCSMEMNDPPLVQIQVSIAAQVVALAAFKVTRTHRRKIKWLCPKKGI